MLKSMRWHKVSDYRGYLDRRTASDAKRLDAWLEKTGADLYTYESPIDLTRYLQGEWRGCRHYNPERPPCTDHARLFKNSKTGKAWFVSQPYDSPQEAMRQVLPWAKEKGLRATVYSPNASWYYPGSTCLIIIEGGISKW